MHRGDGEGFSEEQLQMYKDCFKLMDINKVLHHTLELGNEGEKFYKFDKPIFLFRSLILFV